MQRMAPVFRKDAVPCYSQPLCLRYAEELIMYRNGFTVAAARIIRDPISLCSASFRLPILASALPPSGIPPVSDREVFKISPLFLYA